MILPVIFLKKIYIRQKKVKDGKYGDITPGIKNTLMINRVFMALSSAISVKELSKGNLSDVHFADDQIPPAASPVPEYFPLP